MPHNCLTSPCTGLPFNRYCIARPGGLGTGPPTGVLHTNYSPDGQGGGEGGSVQRSDLAAFLIDAVTEEHFPHLRKTPGERAGRSGEGRTILL